MRTACSRSGRYRPPASLDRRGQRRARRSTCRVASAIGGTAAVGRRRGAATRDRRAPQPFDLAGRDLARASRAGVQPLVGQRLADTLRWRGRARHSRPASSSRCSSATSSSRTGPSARVIRRTRCARRSMLARQPTRRSTGSASRSRRVRHARLMDRRTSPACAAGMASISDLEALTQQHDGEGRWSMLGWRHRNYTVRASCVSLPSTSAPIPST